STGEPLPEDVAQAVGVPAGVPVDRGVLFLAVGGPPEAPESPAAGGDAARDTVDSADAGADAAKGASPGLKGSSSCALGSLRARQAPAPMLILLALLLYWRRFRRASGLSQ